MPSSYVRKPPVECSECGDEMHRTRKSATGEYFCSKPACQAARRSAYYKANAIPAKHRDEHKKSLRNGAAFLSEALWGERIVCFECGLKNAIPGYGHFDKLGGACAALATRGAIPGITYDHALAVWPVGKREYEVFE
jgi:hypothetical protein